MTEFLAISDMIDWNAEPVLAKARELADGVAGDIAVAERCYLWVRDHVRHSRDFRIPAVTCAASDVLRHGAGYCYAKAHLLAALLRANGIPAALCYQRLRVSETETDQRFCLHGLNAVHLRDHGWYRVDARGSKPGVDAAFCPPVERLAFPLSFPGEYDLPGRFAAPLPEIVDVLTHCSTGDEVFRCLPDAVPPRDNKDDPPR